MQGKLVLSLVLGESKASNPPTRLSERYSHFSVTSEHVGLPRRAELACFPANFYATSNFCSPDQAITSRMQESSDAPLVPLRLRSSRVNTMTYMPSLVGSIQGNNATDFSRRYLHSLHSKQVSSTSGSFLLPTTRVRGSFNKMCSLLGIKEGVRKGLRISFQRCYVQFDSYNLSYCPSPSHRLRSQYFRRDGVVFTSLKVVMSFIDSLPSSSIYRL
ncbi:hypothetical protein K469DRAFT_222697 [Zopfia rhizophila CBS 207.26]|uniref:Uncharacterized protein n=1 Tax=Zopfia rhizophila CBS 207.26 TaxID=1314779 RepID=A0A6A6DXU6_9PEZI|nr:hypothetical protein K469DRAFT_222697 [Zopfia rhizophila CBS 207.26]